MKLTKEPSPNEVFKELQKVIHKRRWVQIVFCGFGEPTERLDCLLRVTQRVKQCYRIPVRLNTNGQAYLLNPGRNVVNELQETGIDRVSVSLNAHNRDVYNKVCRPTLEGAYESVLEFIEKVKKKVNTEITAVDIPEVDIVKMQKRAEEGGVKFRRRAFEPHTVY